MEGHKTDRHPWRARARRLHALLTCAVLLACMPCTAWAANLLVVTTAENGTTDGGAGLNIADNFVSEIQGVPGHTVTVNRGGLTNATLPQAYFTGYDMVFVIGVYQPITAANASSLAAAMAANGSGAFVLFIDTCSACPSTARGTLLNLVNTVAPQAVTYGPQQSGFVDAPLNAATNPYAGSFASKPVFSGVEYVPMNVPAQQRLYLDDALTQLAYMISIPRVESPTRTCLVATSDTSGFANIPPGVVLYPSNRGIGALLVDAATQPAGMCNAINLRLRKALPNGRVAAADQFRLSITGSATTSTATTTGAGTIANGEALLQAVSANASHTFSEAMAAGSTSALGAYGTTYTCTNATPNSPTPMPSSASGTSFSITPVSGDNITCIFSNGLRQADLSVTKTNTPASGANDLPADILTAGATTTYTINVSNAGPAAVANATIRDSAGTGLSNCSVSAQCSVTQGAATCPTASALTYGNLSSGSGVQIPSMSAASTIQFQVRCTVN